MLRHWHSRLNSELFKGELRKLDLTIHPSDRVDGPAYGYFSPDEQVPYINIDPMVITKGMFIATMAHEMVHQLQHQRGLPLTHGRFFKANAKKALKHGIIL